METITKRIAATALLLSPFALTAACSGPYDALPEPTPVQPTANTASESPTVRQNTGPCHDDARLDVGEECTTAITRQLQTQGFDVESVEYGSAIDYCAVVTLKQCEQPDQGVGFAEFAKPIELNVVGGLADGSTFTKPSEIPADRCTKKSGS